jgi:uncharacterized membrane protein
VLVLLGFLVLAALPFVTWWRVSKLEREVATLQNRLRAVEGKGASSAPTAPRMPEPSTVPPPLIPHQPEQVRLAPTATRAMPGQPPRTDRDLLDALHLTEAQIGSRWLLYVGVLAVVVGISYFEKLAIASGWIGETARVVQGAVTGAVLTYAGVRFVRAGYALYGQMLSGTGVAVLYVVTYAAFNLYHLIARPVAFTLMAAITATAAWLGNAQRSQGLALVAVGGGFATPFLLPSRTDAQIALFTYEGILIAGTMYLAHRRTWPVLNAVSYGLTCLTVLSWAVTHYAPDKYLPTELYLTLYCAMFLYIARETRGAARPVARLVEIVLWTAPVLYYLASVAILFTHGAALLVFLLAFTMAAAAVTARVAPQARLLVLIAVLVPLLQWIDGHASRSWLIAGLVTVAGVYAIHLLAQRHATDREGHALTPVDVTTLHLNGLAAFAGAFLLIDAVDSSATAPAAALFALWNGGVALSLYQRQREQALHFAALGFTLLTAAVAIQFDGVWVTIGWAAEGAVVMWLGLRERRDWLRAGGLAIFALAVFQLLDLQLDSVTLDQTVLMNRRAACGAFVIALVYLTAWLHRRHGAPRATAFAVVTAQLLTLSLFTSEIRAFWGLRLASDGWASGTGDGRFVREPMLSITWAAYATGLIVAGIRHRYAPLRYTAFAVFAVTIGKVFAVDLARLDRLYRVSSILGLGVLLLLTSYLYHRFRGRIDEEGASSFPK